MAKNEIAMAMIPLDGPGGEMILETGKNIQELLAGMRAMGEMMRVMNERMTAMEQTIRTLENPQSRHGVDRAASMAKLLESLKRDGYRDDKPIVVMLCRTGGLADSLRQGHHRVSACLSCGIDRMAVEFAAAGVAPWQRWAWTRKNRERA